MKSSQLAVLITCYNRKNITLACLQALYAQQLDLNFDVYLVDDGSTDGTAEAVNQRFPDVNVIFGNGNLFWGGGMRLAFSEAIKGDYDYYLWLNDDTLIEENAIARMIALRQELLSKSYDDTIVVGSTKDPQTGNPTYGGAKSKQSWYSKKYEFIGIVEQPQECETMFGNCVLITRSVVKKVGNIDSAFVHSMGDLDYGLRAGKLGCSIWVLPDYVGTCRQNSIEGSWVDTSLSIIERLRKAFQPKGFPIKSWTTFVRRHFGFSWYLYWLTPYIRAIIGYKNLNSSFFEEK